MARKTIEQVEQDAAEAVSKAEARANVAEEKAANAERRLARVLSESARLSEQIAIAIEILKRKIEALPPLKE